MKRLVTLLLAALPIVPAVAQADPVQAVLGDPALLSAPGCALGVYQNGRLTKFASSGAADVASGRAMNADTQFYAASVSKQFTTLAAMQLVEKGKLRLDDDIRTYLPELPDYGHKVSVAMLMNHTAGIRDSLDLLYLSGHSDVAAASRAEALKLTLAQTATKFQPGTRYDYSNGGYLLLSEIIERVSGEPFAAYVNRAVLKPIGMNRSFVMAGARSTDTNIARGYQTVGGKVVLADSYPLFGGSGGLITTINDLAKYSRDIDSGHKVWTPAIRKLMLEPGHFNDGRIVRREEGSSQAYAAGLTVGPHWFGHTGGARGFKTMYAHLPERRMGVGLLCNNGDIDPGQTLGKIVAALPEALPALTDPKAVLEGRYRSADLDVVYKLTPVGDDLQLEILPAETGGPPLSAITLKPAGDGYSGPGIHLQPELGGSGLVVKGSRVDLKFHRI